MEIALFSIAVILLIVVILETIFIVYLNKVITQLRDDKAYLKNQIRNVDKQLTTFRTEKRKGITLANKKGVWYNR